jgi:hypothetical protein
MGTQLLTEHRRQAGAIRPPRTLGQHSFDHRIVAGERRAQVGGDLARFGVGLAGHGLARGIDQAGAGLAMIRNAVRPKHSSAITAVPSISLWAMLPERQAAAEREEGMEGSARQFEDDRHRRGPRRRAIRRAGRRR